jgi:hypothetical protein
MKTDLERTNELPPASPLSLEDVIADLERRHPGLKCQALGPSPGHLRLVSARGRMLLPAPRPKGYRHQKRPKECFSNAQITVFACKEAHYVEGVAVGKGGSIVQHGWVTLDGVHAVDQTRTEPALAYFGIIIPTKELAQIVCKRGYAGAVLDECHESWQELDGYKEWLAGLKG